MKNKYITYLLVIFFQLTLPLNLYAHGEIPIEPQAVDINSFPPIEQDIQALSNYGMAAQQAGERLVKRGSSALYDLHHALTNPVSYQQQLQVMTVLGQIGDISSAELMIEAAEQSSNRYLSQNTLLALSNLEQSEDITEFVDRQLENKNTDPLITRSALAYYTKQPQPNAFHWVNEYNQANTNADVRYAALYLGGVLGVKSVKSDIISMLSSPQNSTREYYLLLGLAEITELDEFNQLLEKLNINKYNVNRVRKYAEFRHSSTADQARLAEQLINENDKSLKDAALNYLIKTKNADVLDAYWKRSDNYVTPAIKRAGFEIVKTEQGVKFKEHQEETSINIGVPFILISMLLTIVYVYITVYKARLNK